MLKISEASHDLEHAGMDDARNGAAIMVPKLVWVARECEPVVLGGEHLKRRRILSLVLSK